MLSLRFGLGYLAPVTTQDLYSFVYRNAFLTHNAAKHSKSACEYQCEKAHLNSQSVISLMFLPVFLIVSPNLASTWFLVQSSLSCDWGQLFSEPSVVANIVQKSRFWRCILSCQPLFYFWCLHVSILWTSVPTCRRSCRRCVKCPAFHLCLGIYSSSILLYEHNSKLSLFGVNWSF